MIRKATVGALVGLALVLACANPVKLGLQGLETDVDSLAEKIEAGVSLTEQVAALEQEVTAKPSEEFLPRIEEITTEIGEILLLEEQLAAISDSLAVLGANPKATEPLKKDISALNERIEELPGKMAVLTAADTKLDELKIKIEEAKKGI